MKLSDLRTPPPLRDSDYAAIRARVMAEIAHDRQRRPFWQFAFALAAMLAAVLWFMPHREETTPARPAPPRVAVVSRPAPPPVIAIATPAPDPPPTTASTPAAPRVPASNQQPATSNAAARESLAAAPMKIEIHTADPDVRIIWIVSPDNAREES